MAQYTSSYTGAQIDSAIGAVRTKIPIANGGTNATTAADARANLGVPALVSDRYVALMPSDGSTNNWIQVGTSGSTYGLLPSTMGQAGSGHNYLGTDEWYWKYAFIDQIYGYLNGNISGNAATATKATKDSDGNTINSTYLKRSGGTITGDLTVNGTAKIGNANALGKFNCYNSDGWSGTFESGSNSIILLAYSGGQGMFINSKLNSSTGYLLQVAYNATQLSTAVKTALMVKSDGKVGIGTNRPSYDLHVVGDIYATGTIIQQSDVRNKSIIDYNLPLTVEQIANAPTIKFTWKDKHETSEQVGTTAQYWQDVLPQVVKNESDELSMQYGVTALVSSIITARKVVDHEKRIAELEEECIRLREENKQHKQNEES